MLERGVQGRGDKEKKINKTKKRREVYRTTEEDQVFEKLKVRFGTDKLWVMTRGRSTSISICSPAKPVGHFPIRQSLPFPSRFLI